MADDAAQQADRDYKWGLRQELLVQALTNRRYQLERQRVMELREGAVKVASLAAGSAAVAHVTSAALIYSAVAVIFIGTSASLVFAWGNKARDAARRAAEWVSLEGEIAAAGERDFIEELRISAHRGRRFRLIVDTVSAGSWTAFQSDRGRRFSEIVDDQGCAQVIH